MTEWQPIETAPKDGTFLGFGHCSEYLNFFAIINYVERRGENGLPESKWEIDEGAFVYEQNTVIKEWMMDDQYEITHWKPLPAPPKEDE